MTDKTRLFERETPRRSTAPAFCVVCFAILVAVAGCDNHMGRVVGTVTLDGDPLANATVEFQPQNGGSPSYAVTDEKGNYQLMYSVSVAGAEVGKHTVRITTYDWLTHADGSKQEIPERVPPQYNANSTLTVEVSAGRQTQNLQLVSDQG